MATLASLVIKLSADSAKFQAGMKKADKDAKKFGSRIDRLGRNMTKTFKSIGVLVGATFVVGGIKKVTEAFIRQEQAIFQLEQRLKSTGGAAGKSSEELQKFASQLQRTTVFGDEATIEMQSLLLTFTKIQGGVFDRATVAVQNVATAMGTDLKSAAIQVGKALNDPKGQLTALSRSGIQFTEDQKDTIKTMVKLGDVAGAQAVILGELENQFGGAAEAAAKGLGGSLKQLNNTFGDTLEIIGGGGAGLTGLIRESNEGLTAFNELIDGIEGSLVNDTLNGMALGFGAIRAGVDSIPELPDWMTDAGSQALQQSLPLWISLAIQVGKVNEQVERLNLPSKVTIPIGDVKAAPVELSTPLPKVEEEKAVLSGLKDFSVSLWESQAVERFEIMSRSTGIILDMERLAQEERGLLIQFGEDVWMTSIESRVEAETRGIQMILDAETNAEQAKITMKKNAANATMGILSALQSGAMKNSKKGFEIAKAAAIGETVINTYKAATGAYSAMASIPIIGPALGIAAAAAATAAGLANVSAISSQSFGSGGGGAGGGSTGAAISGPSFAPQQAPEIGTDQASVSRAITINFHGFVGDLDQLAREVIPSITKAIGDGKQVEVFA